MMLIMWPISTRDIHTQHVSVGKIENKILSWIFYLEYLQIKIDYPTSKWGLDLLLSLLDMLEEIFS